MASHHFYRDLGEPFIQELCRLLRKREPEHIALLGPRGAGKSMLLQVLMHRLGSDAASSRQQVVLLRMTEHDFKRPADLLGFIRSALGLSSPENDERDDPQSLSHAILDLFQRRLESIRSLVVFVDHLPRLPTPWVRSLLGAFQQLHEGEPSLRGRVGAVITGAEGFLQFTQGPNSPYRHARQFIMQGMDRDTLARYLISCNQPVDLASLLGEPAIVDHFETRFEPGAIDLLLEETAGNLQLAQEVMLTAQRNPEMFKVLHEQNGGPFAWRRLEIKEMLKRYKRHYLFDNIFVRMVLREAERDEHSFDRLHQLIEGRNPPPLTLPYPTNLEIAGVIRRDELGAIRVASPLWKLVLRKTFQRAYIADVLARQRRWSKAWEIYEALPRARIDRPPIEEYRLRNVLQEWHDEFIMLASARPREV